MHPILAGSFPAAPACQCRSRLTPSPPPAGTAPAGILPQSPPSGRVFRGKLRQYGFRSRFIPFNCDNRVFYIKIFHHRLNSRHYIRRIFDTLAVIGCYVRLALGGVYYQGIGILKVGRVELYMGRKTRSAQTDKPRSPHRFDKIVKALRLFGVVLLRVNPLLPRPALSPLAAVLTPAGQCQFGYRNHPARHPAVD